MGLESGKGEIWESRGHFLFGSHYLEGHPPNLQLIYRLTMKNRQIVVVAVADIVYLLSAILHAEHLVMSPHFMLTAIF